MVRVGAPAVSRHGREAVVLLGQSIRMARLARRMKASELAERAGMSRGLLHRIEKGDPACTIGRVFEVASILGLRLFDADPSDLRSRIAGNRATLALLPRAVRDAGAGEVVDDF